MRFLMVITIIMASVALFALDMTTPHAQAANALNCVSAIPSPVQGTPSPAPTAPGTIFINEVLTNPNTAWNCADQSSSPKGVPKIDTWIELYNAQNQSVDLSSLYFSINFPQENNPIVSIPLGSVIAPHGFLIVFPLISSPASTITSAQLMIPGTVIDSVSNIPTLSPGQSYARIPDGGRSDGSSNWQVSNYPTIEASNRLDPPTPTPTPTKTPKTSIPRIKTPRAKRSTSSRHNSSSSQSDLTANPTSSSTSASSTNDGMQPSWRTLQFPGGTITPSPTLATVTPPSSTPQQSADTSDLPKKIIISVSVAVLAFALLWCGKHFLSS